MNAVETLLFEGILFVAMTYFARTENPIGFLIIGILIIIMAFKEFILSKDN